MIEIESPYPQYCTIPKLLITWTRPLKHSFWTFKTELRLIMLGIKKKFFKFQKKFVVQAGFLFNDLNLSFK